MFEGENLFNSTCSGIRSFRLCVFKKGNCLTLHPMSCVVQTMNNKEGSRNFPYGEQRRFTYPQSVREINKLPRCFFKNKQLSKSHSKGASHTPLPPPEIKSQQRAAFYFQFFVFYFYCTIPLYVFIYEPNQANNITGGLFVF